MTSKEKLNSIESLINEFYHDMKCKGNLNDCANECWKEYQEFCEDIKQDIERLEKLEKANASLHTKCESLQIENEIWKKAIENSNKAYDVLMQNSNIQFLNQNQENAKLEKVIEILKRFNFTMYTIKNNNNETAFKIYTDCLLETQELTQEEYELLKEYFGNVKD